MKISFAKQTKNPKLMHPQGYPEVDNWDISQFILKKIIPITGTHPYPLSELQLMVDAVIWTNPKKIMEWGTHIGVAARIFSETISHYHLDSHVYSIDLPEDVFHSEHPHNNRGMLVKNKSNVTLIQGDGISESIKVIGRNKGSNVLFFLDGDHEYASVARELEIIGKRYPHAAIIGHDTFYQHKKSGYNIGPYRAFAQFLSKYKNKYLTYQTCLGLPGMTLLIPKG